MEKIMKIAVISDIHGNLQALDAVLENIKKENCDKIFCLGDLAMAGPQPNETINKIKELMKNGNFELIQGNTDEYLGQNSDEMHQIIAKANPIMASAYNADRKVISEENLEFLKNLPSQKTIEINGVKILLVHGSPRANNENIFPEMPLEKIEEMLVGVGADLVFCGHTHQPCGYQTNTKQTVVNVGSVGRPLNEYPKACYLLLEVFEKTGEFFVEHKLINYDKEKASELLRQRDFDGAEKLAGMLISASERYPA